jgi:hypothetical protein
MLGAFANHVAQLRALCRRQDAGELRNPLRRRRVKVWLRMLQE